MARPKTQTDEERRAKRAAYMRKYRAEHPDVIMRARLSMAQKLIERYGNQPGEKAGEHQ